MEDNREESAGISKAEALRLAQLRLLKGSGTPASASNTSQRSSAAVDTNPLATTAGPFKPNPSAKYSHPYYWTPFILIGNWK